MLSDIRRVEVLPVDRMQAEFTAVVQAIFHQVADGLSYSELVWRRFPRGGYIDPRRYGGAGL